MTASHEERDKVKEYLPYNLLRELYLNSRTSITELTKRFGISHYTITKSLAECQKKYGLIYTLDINTDLLGFSEARIVVIKFGKMPDLKLLNKIICNDIYIQNAYTAVGDFDLVLHVLAPNPEEYNHWEFRFRIGLSLYKPDVKTSNLNHIVEGFLPINKDIIEKSKNLKPSEKLILSLLLQNARIEINSIAKSAKISSSKVIYIIRKLQKRGIIKKFTSCIQSSDKGIAVMYCTRLKFSPNHHKYLLSNLLNIIIGGENYNNITTDYSLTCEVGGYFDGIDICNFSDGDSFDKRGPNLIKKEWAEEEPIIEQGILIGLIKGIWPFNKNDYYNSKKILDTEMTNPVKFKIYK